MSASPADIKRAVWVELARLVSGYTVTDATAAELDGIFSPPNTVPTSTRPFRSLHHFAGEVSRALSEDREHGVAMTHIKQQPAMLLAWEGTRPVGAEGAYAADGPKLVQVVRRAHFRVFVVVADQRGDARAMDTAIAAQGALESALAGFVIPGLFDGRGVTWVESLPWVTARRASYVSAVRFHADALLDPTDEPEPAEGFEVRGAVVDASLDSDDATVPIAPFRTAFELD